MFPRQIHIHHQCVEAVWLRFNPRDSDLPLDVALRPRGGRGSGYGNSCKQEKYECAVHTLKLPHEDRIANVVDREVVSRLKKCFPPGAKQAAEKLVGMGFFWVRKWQWLKPALILWAVVARLKPCPYYKTASFEFSRGL